ncbi:ATPase [Pseudooceanicola nanhaiensis]|uniref:ATPase n=1 Tax=Pseudooceanicola nanhaiensis TaxID=375761 RepID=UPI001CD6B449|nr:ATPase [Pseudooceanicola nanhaiensis]MCA0921769.1 ATPase [Pseudooceanicola nanhaiensis]
MIYGDGQDWLKAERKKVVLFGMSGLGKTHVSNLLRGDGDWFHYSVDYRIGTRYMGEHIADNAKKHAMQVPFLRHLLMTDSIYIGSNITFNNLTPLSTYLGKPGDPDKGGLTFAEYMRRQEQHMEAEVAALLDTAHFSERALRLYGYPHFVCDSGGSICEVVDPADPEDPVLKALESEALLIWLKGSEAHTEELIRRFDRAPKPMYYQTRFLTEGWAAYQEETGQGPEEIDPDAFVRWSYGRALAHRQPRYAAMAERGVTVTAEEVSQIRTAADFETLVARALDRR